MNWNFRVNYTRGIYTDRSGGDGWRGWIIKVARWLVVDTGEVVQHAGERTVLVSALLAN